MRVVTSRFAGIGAMALILIAILSVIKITFAAALTDATSTDTASTSVPTVEEDVSVATISADSQSSDSPATSTDQTAVDSVLPETEASPMESPVAPTSTVATTTPSVEQDTPAPNPAGVDTPESIEKGISDLQDAYHKKTGKYLQVIPGNVLPSYENGSVSEKLGTTISQDVQVDVYDGPNGRGYQILFVKNGAQYSFGYGPEAVHRTYTIIPHAATSTVAVQ